MSVVAHITFGNCSQDVIRKADWFQQSPINSFLNPLKLMERIVDRARLRSVVSLEGTRGLAREIWTVASGRRFG